MIVIIILAVVASGILPSLLIMLTQVRNQNTQPVTQSDNSYTANTIPNSISSSITAPTTNANITTGSMNVSVNGMNTSTITTSVTTTTTSITTTTVTTTTTSITTTTTSVTTTTASLTTVTTTSTFHIRWNLTALTVAGITNSGGAGVSQLKNPWGINLDSSNSLFIADMSNHRVQKWVTGASNGTTLAGFGNGSSGGDLNSLYLPGDVDVDSAGNIWIADTYNHRVMYWANGASSGVVVAGTGIAGNLSNQLNYPYGIAHDWSSRTLYIADQQNHRIMRYLSNASSGSIVAGGNGQGFTNTQLYLPVSVFFDSSSNSLFIANFGANNVVRWVLGVSSWTLIGGSASGIAGSSSTALNKPEDITLDSLGNIYVADSNNNRVQFFLTGQLNGTTIAGVTGTQGNTASLLNRTVSVAVDAQFNLYVSDNYNQRIQKFLHY